MKEGNVSYNDALGTFYLRLYGHRLRTIKIIRKNTPRHIISSKESFISTIPQVALDNMFNMHIQSKLF